jgi:predicted phosphodiesterase
MANESKLEKILHTQGLSEKEAIQLLKTSSKKPTKPKTFSTNSEHIKYGYFSDAHIGEKHFDEPLFLQMVEHFNDEKVEFIVDAGDHLEGMSGREGHIYELQDIGFNPQMNHAVKLYSKFVSPIFGIDGNHDLWYKSKNSAGVVPGEVLEARVPNYTHLGEWEGDLDVGSGKNKVWIKLFHSNDGTAYADSYKLQKLIESFTGGEKPNIVHSGHYHKAIALFRRNVWGFESGTLCGQSQFMRGKKLQAHKGYGLVEFDHSNGQIEKLTHTFVPDYD